MPIRKQTLLIDEFTMLLALLVNRPHLQYVRQNFMSSFTYVAASSDSKYDTNTSLLLMFATSKFGRERDGHREDSGV